MKISWFAQKLSFLKTNKAFGIIFLLGIVSLFGDTLYEGARSVSGPYLKLLGANAFWVGFIFGLGEFFNFALRFPAGYLVDRTRHYWPFMFIGYGFLFVIPLLANANTWQIAAILFLTERIVKAIRSPAKDSIVSFVSKSIGTGLGFGIHEFTDQLGGIIGPLFFSYFLATTPHNNVTGYHTAFSYLWLVYFAMILVLFMVYKILRTTEALAPISVESSHAKLLSISASVYHYLFFVFISIFGFANFSLIGFHLKKTALIPEWQIPLLYSIVMALVGVSAIVLGKFYDVLKLSRGWQKASVIIFIPNTVLLAFLPITALSLNTGLVYIGITILGITMGTQTIIRAVLADIVSQKQRATIYGTYNLFYGTAFFLGGSVMGYLYDMSRTACITFACITQCTALLFLIIIFRHPRH